VKLFSSKTKRRPITKGVLSNVEVDLISLLFDDMKPANQKGAIFKSADGKSRSTVSSSAKFKAEAVGTEGLIYVTVMEPGVVDAQGDTYTADEVKKAAHRFAHKGLVEKCDVNHNNHPAPEFVIAESYILKTEDRDHFPSSKPGSWVAVLKCEDLQSDLWQKVVKGQFNGVSIAGTAEDSPSPNAAAITEMKALLADLKKTLSAESASQSASSAGNTAGTQEALATIESKIAELEKADNSAATTELIKAFTDQIKELNVAITRAISKSLKGEPGEADTPDRTIDMGGTKVVIKSTHKDIYKGIAQVDGGSPMNILTSNTTSLFIDEVIGSSPSDTLSDITVVPLLKDNKIDAGLIADLVLTNSLDDAAAAQNVASADITLTPGILTGEVTLGRDIMEFYKDKYGEEAFGAYVEQHLAKKAEKAIRLLLFKGDRGSATAKLKGLDGVIAIAGDASPTDVTSLDDELYPTWVDRLQAALVSFDDDVLEDQANFVIYVSFKDLIRIKAELAQRETNEGDRLLLVGGNVSFDGIPIKARLMPDNYIVAGLPKFIILGFRTDAELKVEHHGSDWKYHWYIRLRAGITYLDGFVKVFLVA